MLHSTFELISFAASNSLLVFCFCNLIIMFLLVLSSNSSSEVDDEEKPNNQSLPSIVRRDQENSISFDINAESESPVAITEAAALLQKNVEAPAAESIETSTVSITVIDDCGENSEDEEEDDDELRRKVEEFIEKVNRGWKEEKLRTSYAFVH